MDLQGIDVACLQETWRDGADTLVNGAFTILQSCPAARAPGSKGHQPRGLAIVLGADATRAWRLGGSAVPRFGKPGHERVLAASLGAKDARGRPLKVLVATVYAPVEGA